MDTRGKIIAPRCARQIAADLRRHGCKIRAVAGTFDVLLPAHVRHLVELRAGTGAEALMVVLLPAPVALLSDAGRAELVAALAMVDYVVTAAEDGVEEFLSSLPADEVVSRQAADETQQRLLIQHVQSRHRL